MRNLAWQSRTRQADCELGGFAYAIGERKLHSLIIGITGCGKTTLATQISTGYSKRGRKVLILDPLMDRRWTGHVFQDSDEFLAEASKQRQCALFIDESGEMIGRYKDEMFWLATRARHYGHDSHFVCQRAQQLALTVRTQCESLACFRVSEMDAKLLADDWARPELKEACNLDKGEFIYAKRFGASRKLQVFRPGLRRVA